MDVGECSNGRSFMLWAAVGIDSRIVEGVEPRSRLLKRFGLAGYVAKATVPFLFYRGAHMRVSVDNETVEGDFLNVTVCNTRLYAGGLFNFSPHSVLDDGKLDIWILRGRFSPHMLLHSAQIITGNHFGSRDILYLAGRHVIIESEPPQPFHLDGELNRSHADHLHRAGALSAHSGAAGGAGGFVRAGKVVQCGGGGSAIVGTWLTASLASRHEGTEDDECRSLTH